MKAAMDERINPAYVVPGVSMGYAVFTARKGRTTTVTVDILSYSSFLHASQASIVLQQSHTWSRVKWPTATAHRILKARHARGLLSVSASQCGGIASSGLEGSKAPTPGLCCGMGNDIVTGVSDGVGDVVSYGCCLPCPIVGGFELVMDRSIAERRGGKEYMITLENGSQMEQFERGREIAIYLHMPLVNLEDELFVL